MWTKYGPTSYGTKPSYPHHSRVRTTVGFPSPFTRLREIYCVLDSFRPHLILSVGHGVFFQDGLRSRPSVVVNTSQPPLLGALLTIRTGVYPHTHGHAHFNTSSRTTRIRVHTRVIRKTRTYVCTVYTHVSTKRQNLRPYQYSRIPVVFKFTLKSTSTIPHRPCTPGQGTVPTNTFR